MKKRALSLLMSLVMLVSMLPTTAWAADTTETTNEVEIALSDCEVVGTYNEDYEAYLFDGTIPKGMTTISFVDFKNSMSDEYSMIASMIGNSLVMGTYKAPITQGYAMDATDKAWNFKSE